MKHAKQKILVVDDEYSFCKFMKEYLERLGYAVTICMNGEQALDLIAGEKPDLITLDLRMPGINGFDILGALRENGSSAIVVVISALDNPGMEQQLVEAGAHAVLHKPVNLKNLVNVIGDLLRQSS